LKPQTNKITSPKVIEVSDIYKNVGKYPNVFRSQFNFKGGNIKRTLNNVTKKTRK
jgi:hypothetical protein